MKSTGLFGKNRGRVGGVVYSNYRGQQIVRSYQPQVKNPNTVAQVGQRAKFKLASQVATVLGKYIASNYSNDDKLSNRNAYVKNLFSQRLLRYTNKQAIVNVADLELSRNNSRFPIGGRLSTSTPSEITAVIESYDTLEEYVGNVRFVGVLLGFDNGVPRIVATAIADGEIQGAGYSVTGELTFLPEEGENFTDVSGLTLLTYAIYENKEANSVSYSDIFGDTPFSQITLDAMLSAGKNFVYTSTLNRTVTFNA